MPRPALVVRFDLFDGLRSFPSYASPDSDAGLREISVL
jgi:hypothetical protein